MTIETREKWLTTAASILIDEIIQPSTALDIPLIHYSLTAPKTSQKKGRVLGECWDKRASTAGIIEIFITANLGESDSIQILSVLTHEIIHAIDNNEHGHGPEFQRLCRLVGLKGGNNGRSKESYTCTEPTEGLLIELNDIIETIGAIPHAAMNVELNGQKKQKNRQLLVKCTCCEFKFRASQKVIDSMTINTCLSCNQNSLEIEVK